MKVIIGGCRGTNPVSHPDFMKYGGATTSLLVEGDGGERILIDAGTGVGPLGQRLESSHPDKDVMLLLTHYHLDHVMGLPSLSLIYKQRWKIQIASPVRQGFRVEEVMPRIFDKPYWPLQVEDMASHLRFTSLNGETSASPLRCGGLEVRWCPLHHPGGSTAYRIDESGTGSSFVLATDMEWAQSSAAEQQSLVRLIEGAGVLVMDGQFTPDEYASFAGWGHSTWRECCDVARHAGVQKVLVSHHAPWRNDEALDAIEKDIRAYWPAAALACAGQEIVIKPTSSMAQQ